MKPVSKDHGEICYPFIYEDSPVCDFEIAADELCSRIGLVLTKELDPLSHDILTRVQPNVYHLNGSVRGKLAIGEKELQELYQDYNLLRDKLDGGFKGFVLPGGDAVAAELHLCRTQAKKIVRALVASNIQENVHQTQCYFVTPTCLPMSCTHLLLIPIASDRYRKWSLLAAATEYTHRGLVGWRCFLVVLLQNTPRSLTPI